MMRSLFSGVSGLKNHQTRMDTIGNNISNVNTTGFKSSRTTFVDTLNQTLSGASKSTDNVGGTNPKQIGLGSSVASVDMLFTDGSVQSTGKNTDMCLSGNGLFIVKSGNSTYYTRDGAFEFDADGNYVLPSSGFKVQGWVATDGVLPASKTEGNLADVSVKVGKSMAAEATKTATYTNNLSSATPTIVSMKQYDPDPNVEEYIDITEGTATSEKPIQVTLSDGTTYTETSGSYKTGYSLPITTTINVYDSLGNKHSIPVYFTKTSSDGNSWMVGVDTNALSGASSATINESDGSQTTVAMTNASIVFKDTGTVDTINNNKFTLTLTNGSTGTQEIQLDFKALTQYSGNSTVAGSADGHADGTLESISIDSTGCITGTYTNGVKQIEAQIAIAQFANAAGLTKTGNSLYQQSNNSGDPNVKDAATLGVTITPSALEMSNVDISNEFSDMIITQRGFQSNSKIITVSDEMLETLINMKR